MSKLLLMEEINQNENKTQLKTEEPKKVPKFSYYFTLIVLYGINPIFINFFLTLFAFSMGLNLYFVVIAAVLIIVAYVPTSKSIIREDPNIKISRILIVLALAIFASYSFETMICSISWDPCDKSEMYTLTSLFQRYFWHLLVFTILVLSKYRYQKTQIKQPLVN
ncbi:MAG TPA: hypothetical protein PK863_05015 [Candidatus Dojkabacteria bacterium]|nr:hypothetical protein [Candidatus Dojkabacteria bacterium]HRP51295.1 hypothetical protein [Candidatus Dojkabacteria bacterium]